MRFTEEEFNQLQARQAKSKTPAPKQSTSKAKLHALGRKKKGEMNATEAKFANYLRGLEITGEILWWRHEGIKLQLADSSLGSSPFSMTAFVKARYIAPVSI